MATTRRAFLKSVSAGSVAAAIPGWANGQTQRKVSLTIPWLASGTCMVS